MLELVVGALLGGVKDALTHSEGRHNIRQRKQIAYKNTPKGPNLLPEDEYSYQDLVKSNIHYAEHLNANSTLTGNKTAKTYAEPDYNVFKKIISRSISENKSNNSAHKKELLCVYKIFLYNYYAKLWYDTSGKHLKMISELENILTYSLSVVSAKHELMLNGIDLLENNAAERRARELYREYFPDLFEQDENDAYKKHIHSILTGDVGEYNDSGAINLLEKYYYLLKHPGKYVKRGKKTRQKDAEEDKKKIEQEKEREKQRKEKVRLKEAEKLRLKLEAKAEKQRQIAEAEAVEQRKKERLLHADDDL